MTDASKRLRELTEPNNAAVEFAAMTARHRAEA